MSEINRNIRICFLADKHNLYDDRIYWKMAVPLVERGYEVYYFLIQDINEKGITKEGVRYEILKVKTFSDNKYLNFILKNLNLNNNYKKLYSKAGEIEADIYHFHDLWINKIGKKLKKLKQKPIVFYDVREPYAEDYISYTNQKGFLKKGIELFSFIVDRWEKKMAKQYDLIISNEDIVRDSFRSRIGSHKAVTLYNFTDNYKLFKDKPISKKQYDFIYSGSITKLRGAFKILEAVKLVVKDLLNVKVVFVGRYSPVSLKSEMQGFIESNKLDKNVELHSFVNYSEISKYYNKSKVGFITPLPEPSFKIKMFIKIFDYMAFGIPIIGSNFGHIKEYVKMENCGVLVNPESSIEISKAMIKLLTDVETYNLYSKNGRSATLEKYKWDFELEKLISFYEKSLKKNS